MPSVLAKMLVILDRLSASVLANLRESYLEAVEEAYREGLSEEQIDDAYEYGAHVRLTLLRLDVDFDRNGEPR